MKKLALALIMLSGVVHAQDRPSFYVKTFATVLYPDGTKVDLQEDKVLIIEDFKCAVTTGTAPKASDYFGPVLICQAPGIGEMAVVARCNVFVPDNTKSVTLQLHSDKSSEDEDYTQVTIGCETTYTRVQRTAAPKKKKTSGA